MTFLNSLDKPRSAQMPLRRTLHRDGIGYFVVSENLRSIFQPIDQFIPQAISALRVFNITIAALQKPAYMLLTVLWVLSLPEEGAMCSNMARTASCGQWRQLFSIVWSSIGNAKSDKIGSCHNRTWHYRSRVFQIHWEARRCRQLQRSPRVKVGGSHPSHFHTHGMTPYFLRNAHEAWWNEISTFTSTLICARSGSYTGMIIEYIVALSFFAFPILYLTG